MSRKAKAQQTTTDPVPNETHATHVGEPATPEEVAQEVGEGAEQYAEEQQARVDAVIRSLKEDNAAGLDALEALGVRAHVWGSNVSGEVQCGVNVRPFEEA